MTNVMKNRWDYWETLRGIEQTQSGPMVCTLCSKRNLSLVYVKKDEYKNISALISKLSTSLNIALGTK